MLDAFIIEELKRREKERQRSDDAKRPRLEISIPLPDPGQEMPLDEPSEHDSSITIDM